MDKLHMIAHIILIVMGLNVGLKLFFMDVISGMLILITLPIPGITPILLMVVWPILVAASAAYCAFLMITGKHKH